MMNTTSVDAYLADGCGRCDDYRTPRCKVHLWTEPLVALRALVQASGLTEEMKWGSPCYTLGGKNVVMLSAFRDACAISFLKGVLLDDPRGLLERPGPNTRVARVVRFTSVEQVRERSEDLERLLQSAIDVERSGISVPAAPSELELPAELQARLDEDAALAAAFQALTPGRRRSHALHIGGAKQAKTRVARVERCVPKILAGKGFNER